jgi:CO/xanthine dehydrogenase Mo-binding subunit
MGTGTSTAVAVRVADHLGRSADSVYLDYTGPVWKPLGLVEAERPWGLSQEEQDRASKNPRWVPVIATRSSASVGAPFTTYAVSQAAELLLRHSLWPLAQEIWNAGPLEGEAAGLSVAFENLRWLDGALTAKGLEPIPLEQLARRAHEKGAVTGVMIHAFNRWSWARAEFEIGGKTWQGDIDALAIRRGGHWEVQDRRKIHYPAAGFKRVSSTYVSTCGAVVALSVDRTNGNVEILNVHEVLDCGRVLIPEQVSAIAQGGIAMGIGHALTEFLPLYEDGPGNGTWNLNRYRLVRARDLPLQDITLETLPPLGDTDIPKGIAEIVMVPVVPGILNAIHDAIGVRFSRTPVSVDDITGAL